MNYLDRRRTDLPRTPLAPDPTRRRLTARELEIALLVGDGMKDALIAERLGLAVSSTGLSIRRILRRLRLKHRQELAEWIVDRRVSDDDARPLRRVEVAEVS